MIQERTLIMEEPASDLRKGSGTLKVGMVLKTDPGSGLPYEVFWAEFNQPKAELAAFKKLLQLEPLTKEELYSIRPYHFKDVYLSRESDASLKDAAILELATTAWMPLEFEKSWLEDVDALRASIQELDAAQVEDDYSIVRPHWTQVEADKKLADAVDSWAAQQSRFIRYWKDRVPFDKDETFQLLVSENLIRHPDSIRY
ncbi:hypothetical protein [Faecalibaculum rodentium]|uniref:hypothetical protein n=1 Tax=Faecalibaculum rodentium TaxID=1702221 RepID=UPI0023F5567A|nr:hypothetical protein [Faecalibaculum rodentium]